MKPIIREYRIHQIVKYINWIYFFHAWGFEGRFASISEACECEACRLLWVREFPLELQPKAKEAAGLYNSALELLNRWDALFRVKGVFRLCSGGADGDDLLLDGVRLPLLRQQLGAAEGPCLCLADFVRPVALGGDTVGVFASTVDPAMEYRDSEDAFLRLLAQTLCDRLAEATAECLHEEVRKRDWGYAPNEQLSMREMHAERFQGIRPAVGYPSLPDQSINFILAELLDFPSFGIELTENGMMVPHASVSGLMISHTASRYFSIGHIGEDQLRDYAERRGLSTEVLRKFLAANLQ